MEPIDANAAARFLAKHADSVSQNGFLPGHLPLRKLPDLRYSAWESIAANLPTLISTGRIRNAIAESAIESTQGLRGEDEWRRAYVLLTYMSHAYIWGGDQPVEILPPQLSIPLLRVSSHLALPPVLTCAAANLWNFTSRNACCFSSLSSLAPLVSFTVSPTESWFLMVGVAVESLGGTIIQTIRSAVRAAIARDFSAVAAALLQLAGHCEEITAILTRLPEQCDPATFYHEVRPFYAGTKNMTSAGLPRGVLYDTGNGKGEWKQLRGGSNGQSSLFPLIDLALGIQHTASTATDKCRRRGDPGSSEDDYHVDILSYMPREHRCFLADFAQIWNVHDVINAIEDPDTSEALRAAHLQATTAVVRFRSKHMQIVTRYIILPSTRSAPPAGAEQDRRRRNLATWRTTSAEHTLIGTSGTQLMPFFKNARQQTMTAASMYSREASELSRRLVTDVQK